MNPRRPGIGEAARHRNRIGAVLGLIGVIALPEPDDAPSKQVNGRVQLDHADTSLLGTADVAADRAHTSTKFDSNASPGALDFSGWN